MIGAEDFFRSFLGKYVSCHPSFCMRGTSNLQLLVWLFLVKLRASLVTISVCVL